MGGSQNPGPTTVENRRAVDLPGPGAVQQQQGSAGTNQPQAPGPRLVGWPRKIEWREFPNVKARPSGAEEDAQIRSEGVLDTNIRPQQEKGRFRIPAITIRVTVVRADTWVVQDKRSDALLAHEQRHFDIAGLIGREMGTALLAIRAADMAELQQEVTRNLEHYGDQAKKIDKEYDDETENGRNADKQRQWEKKIQDCMDNGTRLAPAP